MNTSRWTWADRWNHDVMNSMHGRMFIVSREMDMSSVRLLIENSNALGRHITYTHVFVRACALVLAHSPGLRARGRSGPVDITVSIAGNDMITPTVTIRRANEKLVQAIGDEIATAIPKAQQDFANFQRFLRRWGWLAPFGWLRRTYLKWVIARPWFVDKTAGDLMLSGLPMTDLFAPFQFITPAIVGVGGVRDRVVAEDGRCVVKPTVWITCCADHRAWNGMQAAVFLDEINSLLTSSRLKEQLMGEEQSPCAPHPVV